MVFFSKIFNFAEQSEDAKIKEFKGIREFNDAPSPKFSKFIKFPNLTKKKPMANG